MMANDENLAALLTPVREIAQQAGQAIMKVYDNGFSIVRKHDYSPVTEADIAADKVITESLNALTPNWPVLSEEGNKPGFEERRHWRRYWLVDPLDGTREFIKRNGEFTVNIALIDDGRPVLGVIYVPVSGVCYFAASGAGAFKSKQQDAETAIQTRRWNGKYLTIAGSRSHRSERFDLFLSQFSNYEVICLGSSLKSCYVAEGKADIYLRLGPTSEWDTAAAQCIVEEAGGRMTQTNLEPLRYNTKESLLNPHFIVFGDTGHDWGQYLPKD